jgi:hypothetical protein
MVPDTARQESSEEEAIKKASAQLTKQALAYVKQARPAAQEVIEDLKQGLSLDRIKEAAKYRPEYPEANPFGYLIRTHQKIARMMDDVTSAQSTNRRMQSEAESLLKHAVSQYMLDGGNIGAVGHLMAEVSDDMTHAKTALDMTAAELVRQGFNLAKLQGQALHYQMQKEGSVREANRNHPIATAYETLCKLAEGAKVLEESHRQIKNYHDETASLLKEAMVKARAASV